MAITTAGWEILADIFTGESADTITKMKIGYGTTAEALGDTDLVHPYTDGGFEVATITPSYTSPTLTFTHTFTNTSGAARTVREVGLYTTSGGELVYRKVFTTLHQINNFCAVRNGDDITVTITFTFTDTIVSGTIIIPDADLSYTIHITPACTCLIEGVTQAKMKIGYGTTKVSVSDTDCEHPYTDYGFAVATLTSSDSGVTRTFQKTFTSSNATERPVREVALFTLCDEFLCRFVYLENDIENLCIVPAGLDIIISVIMTFTTSAYTTYSYCDATGIIDLTTFAHPGPVDYNGVVLPNATIQKYDNALGVNTWQFECYSKTYADITKCIRYSGPVTIGRSITGKQYCISSYRSGVLYVKNYDTYYNVYMGEPIPITPFGTGWWFNITVYESAYVEDV